MAKPTDIPRWADVGGDIVNPPSAKKNTGWAISEKPPSQWFNWWQNVVGEWFKWIDARLFDGATADDFTIQAADKTGTDVDGGDSILSGGASTGSGSSYAALKAAIGLAPGTTPRAPSEFLRADGSTGKINAAKPFNGIVSTPSAAVDGVEATGGTNKAGGKFTGNGTGSGVHGVAGSSNGSGVHGEGDDNGPGVDADGTSGCYGLIARGETNPAGSGRAAARIIPQTALPSVAEKGALLVDDDSGQPVAHNGNEWQRLVGNVMAVKTLPSPIASTAAETAFSTKYTIKGGSLVAGSVLRVRASGEADSVTGTPTLLMRMKIGGVSGSLLLAAVQASVGSGANWLIDAVLTARVVGGSGLIAVSGFGVVQQTFEVTDQPSVAVDTTIDQDLVVTADWSVPHASNSVSLSAFNVDRS